MYFNTMNLIKLGFWLIIIYTLASVIRDIYITTSLEAIRKDLKELKEK